MFQRIHNENKDTVFATLRMCKDFRAALIQFSNNLIHVENGELQVRNGASIVRQGFGWYRIIPSSERRATEDVRFAMKLVRLAFAQYVRDRNAEIQRLQRALLGVTQTVAAVDNGNVPAYVEVRPAVVKHKHKKQRNAPPTASKLQALVNRFGGRA